MIRIVLVAAALLAAAPSFAQKAFLSGDYSSVCEKKMVVVKSQAQWEDLWKQHANDQTAAPSVDFSREMIVAVFLGEKNRAGYEVKLVTMPDPLDKRKLVVFYEEIAPKAAFGAQVISHPYAMIKVKIHASVKFEANQDAGIPDDERRQTAPKRITPDQKVHMYDTVDRLKAFDFTGF